MKSRSFFHAVALTFSLLFFSSACRADVIYTLIPQLVASVFVSGSITTNGKIGILSSADIVGYSISLLQPSNPGVPTETLSSTDPVGAGLLVLGDYLTATSSAISWNFAQGVGAEASIYGKNTITQWHLYTDRIDVDFNGIEYASYRNGTEQIAIASVPEPGSLALLSAGVVGLAWQRKRRGKRA
jgi:hypothetical protein